MKIPNILTFFKAMLRAAWWKLRGRPVLVPSEVQEVRIGKCEGCIWFDPHARQCLDCSCFVDAKTWLASEECHRGRWEQYNHE
jgi:hypothetical protein